jgi:hypothetical protein
VVRSWLECVRFGCSGCLRQSRRQVFLLLVKQSQQGGVTTHTFGSPRGVGWQGHSMAQCALPASAVPACLCCKGA